MQVYTYSYISAACLLIYIHLGVRISKRCTPSKESRLVLALCISAGFWAFCDIFYYGVYYPYNLSLKGFYNFWWCMQMLGMYSYSPIILHIVMSKSTPGLLKKLQWANYTIYIPAFIMMVGNILFGNMWNPPGRALFLNVQIFYYLSYSTISLAFVYLWWKKTGSNREKKQACLIFKCGALSLLCGALYQIGALRIAHVRAPAFSEVFILFMVLVLWYVIVNFNFIGLTDFIKSEEIIDKVNDFIVLTDWNGSIIRVNESLLQNLKYTKGDLIGKPFEILTGLGYSSYMLLDGGKKNNTYDIDLFAADGSAVPVSAQTTVFKDMTDERAGTLVVCRDMRTVRELQTEISHRKQNERQLNYLSMHDSLTGLYNRTFFEEEILRLEQNKQRSLGVIVCDVDGLKLVNDTLGHARGDELLVTTATVLKEAGDGSIIMARIGGDEFAILMPDCSEEYVRELELLINQAVLKYNEQNEGIPLSISTGSAYAVDSCKSAYMLLKEADDSMYKEKLNHQKSIRHVMVQALTNMMKARDFVTHDHIDRMRVLAGKFGRNINLSESQLNTLDLLVQFHDIGKVGIQDSILFKTSSLTPEEMAEMRKHSEIGYKIAVATQDIAPIADLILYHHERWDGLGYPLGLKGEQIPLECRVMSVIDAFDAMTNNRPYRKAMSIFEAKREIAANTGKQFDPAIAAMFLDFVI